MSMQLKRAYFVAIFLLLQIGYPSVYAQIALLRHTQHGYLHNLDIGKGPESKNPKLRVLVLYNDSVENKSFIDSLVTLGKTDIFNRDTFRLYLVKLHKPPVVEGVCPPASRLTFYGKEINHSVISGGIWIFLDTTESKLDLSYWDAVRERNSDVQFKPSTVCTQLLAIPNKMDLYRMVSRPYLQPDNAFRHLQKELETVNDKYLSLLVKFNEKVQYEENRNTRLLSLSLKYTPLSLPKGHLIRLDGFGMYNLINQAMVANLESRIPKTSYVITTNINISYESISGELRQIGKAMNENMGWFTKSQTPYQRMVYFTGLNERFLMQFVSTGVAIGIRKELNNLDLTTSFGAKALNKVHSVVSANARSLSFGGIFPDINPVDTIFSGIGDFYSDIEFSTTGRRVPIERTILGYSFIFGVDYWLTRDKTFGIKGSLCYERYGTVYRASSPRLFESTDLSSYNPLVARLGNASMSGFGLSLGIVYKLQ